MLALLLAVIGIYDVVSYAVNRRTHEISVRLAIGAQRSEILRMILRQGMTLVAIGALINVEACEASPAMPRVHSLFLRFRDLEVVSATLRKLLVKMQCLSQELRNHFKLRGHHSEKLGAT